MKLIFTTVAALITLIICAGSEDIVVPIISYQNEGIHPDGSYKWSYETGNGIVAQEEAQPHSPQLLAAKGSYKYTSPEGVDVFIVYSADENGFTAQGDAIPQPPPIPEPIQKALAWNAAHPEEDTQAPPIVTTPFIPPVRPGKTNRIMKAAISSLQG